MSWISIHVFDQYHCRARHWSRIVANSNEWPTKQPNMKIKERRQQSLLAQQTAFMTISKRYKMKSGFRFEFQHLIKRNLAKKHNGQCNESILTALSGERSDDSSVNFELVAFSISRSYFIPFESFSSSAQIIVQL